MKKINKNIKGTVCVIALIVVSILVLNLIYFKIIIPHKNIYKSEKQLEEFLETNGSIIFLGDSHTARDINPKYIPESFNYAIPSENYEQTYIKVKYLVENSNIQVFVLPFDLHSFTGYRQNPYSEVWYWSDLLGEEELMRLSNKTKTKIFFGRYFPWIGNGHEFLEILSGNTEIVKGWQKIEGNFANSNNKAVETSERTNRQFNNFNKERFSKKQTQAFEDTIDLLKANNKTIILVSYPVTSQYLNKLRVYNITMDEQFENFSGIISSIPWLDYSGEYSKDTGLFYDPDHLNSAGAEEFSKQVSKELKDLIR